MKLSDKYHYTVLCEDAQTRTFVLQFLKIQGITVRRIRVNMSPAGQSCGSEFIRQQYPTEMNLLARKNYLRLTLIVVSDADMMSVEERIRFIESKSDNTDFDREKEPIIFWIPKRQIENWIHFFRNGNTDENTDYRHTGKPEMCKTEASKFSDYLCDIGEEYSTILPSLVFAKNEYLRVCKLQM